MRDPVTTEYFPDKVSIEEFFEILFDKTEMEYFINNMNHLKVEETHYPEDWADMFIRWKELNK